MNLYTKETIAKVERYVKTSIKCHFDTFKTMLDLIGVTDDTFSFVFTGYNKNQNIIVTGKIVATTQGTIIHSEHTTPLPI